MPFDPTGPFLRQDGLREGLTKHHLDGPSYQRVFGSVRLATGVPLTPEVKGRCASLLVPGCAVSHHTAAGIWTAVVPDTPTTHVTVPRAEARRSRPGLVCHVNEAALVHTVRGLRVTTPIQTFVDCAGPLGLVDLAVLGDSLVHQRRVTPAALDGAVRDGQGRRSRLAVEAGALVRWGAESPMETRTRLLLVLAGLPEPVLQHEVGDAHRHYRLDLAYPELKVAIEYDGRQHAESTHQWGHDVGRREWLNGRGWRVLVVRSDDVYVTPWLTVRRVAAVLASRGYERLLPQDAPAGFAQHFPGRPRRHGS